MFERLSSRDHKRPEFSIAIAKVKRMETESEGKEVKASGKKSEHGKTGAYDWTQVK